MNSFNGGAYAPQAFDIALSPPQVLAMAGGFLAGCQASDLGLTSNQPLSVMAMDTKSKAMSTSFAAGNQLMFASVNNITSGASCQLIAGGMVAAMVQPADGCMVPPSMNGPVAVFITMSSTPLASNLVLQNAADVMAGPA